MFAFHRKSQQNFSGLKAAKKVSGSIFQDEFVVTRHLRDLQAIHQMQSKHRVNIHPSDTKGKENERPSSFCKPALMLEQLQSTICWSTVATGPQKS